MNRVPVDWYAGRIVIVLCMIWAIQQIGLKTAATEMTPLVQVALRSAMAAVLVFIVMKWRRSCPPMSKKLWRDGIIVGLLFSVEFFFTAQGLQYSTAGRIVVLLYTAPVFTALWLHWLMPEERLNTVQWFGISLAFLGLLLAFSDSFIQFNTPTLTGDILGLIAGLSWGFLTAWVRCSRLANVSAELTLLFQLACGGILLLLLVAATGELWTAQFTPFSSANLLFQGVVVSFISYLIWFGLLRRYQVSQLGIFSLLTPLFGVVLGAWLLDEALTLHFIVGCLFVLAGVGFVTQGRR